MASKLPDAVVTLMASRIWRMEHYVWHLVRNEWLFFDPATQATLRGMGWEPPRPARRPGASPQDRPVVIVDNQSGEDFLYMHRMMIGAVNALLAGDPSYPRVVGWPSPPPPGDPTYPVPPAWDTGDSDTNEYLLDVKSDGAYARFRQWHTQFTDPAYLRSVTLGELGARIEFSIHNQMHMRWCAEPASGIRPDVEPAVPDTIDPKWDAVTYDWLGDTYSSHVNPVFWMLHGWVDARIDDWARANNIRGEIPWQGTWVGKMPGHHHGLQPLIALGGIPGEGGAAAGHLVELQRVAKVLSATGRFSHIYDRVAFPEDTGTDASQAVLPALDRSQHRMPTGL